MTRLRLERRLPPDLLINAIRADAREGLTATPKYIPSKWLFDSKGSELWEKITQLPEYYPLGLNVIFCRPSRMKSQRLLWQAAS